MSIDFQTHPSRYKHWKLQVEGDRASLSLHVEPFGGLRSDYELKMNSYDLSVDIELADAVQRLRFEHPQVKVVVIRSGHDRVFCSGANIPMLATSKHAFKVNFCKFTNETRLYLEDASRHSGQKYIAALSGPTAGGGYELALACDDVLLVDDGSSSVSLPEVPLLGVLPGTGGLTRLVDKRKVRRDRADVFCTTSEGIRGKRAVEWGLVDAVAPKSKFDAVLEERVTELAATVSMKKGPGIDWTPLTCVSDPEASRYTYEHVTLSINNTTRVAELTLRGPSAEPPSVEAAGAAQWSLQAFRELDEALLRLRFDHLEIGLIVLRTVGELFLVQKADAALHTSDSWLANEILRFQARVLRRLDLSARSIFAIVDKGSCFAGSLLELALAADRIYMLADDDENVAVAVTQSNAGTHPMSTGASRLATRFLATPSAVENVLALAGGSPIPTTDADKLGLVTFAPDEIDWEDDVRIAIEERVSMSPDALSGMEASLRFAGPESSESKVFARLSAWQNWIFQRPNAVGPNGALTKYGQPDRPTFDWTRC